MKDLQQRIFHSCFACLKNNIFLSWKIPESYVILKGKSCKEVSLFMMQRICPVCDQVMKHAHYCSACHSWVKDPVYMNVTYYLNERHPKNEAHCSYHNAEEEVANAGNAKQGAMPWKLGNTGKHARKNVTPNQPGRKAAAKPVGKKKNPVKKLILLYIVLMVVIWLFRMVSGVASSFI